MFPCGGFSWIFALQAEPVVYGTEKMKRPYRARQDSGLFVIVVAVVSIGALYLGRVVLIPFAFALLFSLILTPVVAFFERLKVSRLLAILLVVLSLSGVISLIGWVTSQQVIDLSNQLPTYAKALQTKLHGTGDGGNNRLSKLSITIRQLAEEMAQAIPGGSPQNFKPTADSAPGSTPARPLLVTVVPPANPLESIEGMLGPLADVLVVAVFTIFMLASREDLRDRLIKLVVGGRRLNLMTRAMDETTQRINRYLLLQLCVNSLYGIAVGVALSIIGVPNAALWGLIATVLRFLPYVGPPLAGITPVLISLAIFPGFLHALITLSFYVALEVVVGNVVEPVIYGSHIGLSPLAILVAAVFWTLIWGFPGLLLSTPLTVCLVVIGRYSPKLDFLNTILGDEPVLAPHAQFYQRLLATDQNAARQVLDQYRLDHSLEETYDSVLLPALGLSEQDRHRNELDDECETFIYQAAFELVEELGVQNDAVRGSPKESPAGSASTSIHKPNVLCVPVKDEADAIAAEMLCQALTLKGFDARSLRLTAAPALLRQIRTAKPGVICLSALPPFAVEPARALYSRLRERFADLEIIICFWHFDGDLQKIETRLKLKQGDRVLGTIPDVFAELNEHASAAEKVQAGLVATEVQSPAMEKVAL